MAYNAINTGTSSNDGTGDTERAAFVKCNAMLNELYDTVLPEGEFYAKRTDDAANTLALAQIAKIKDAIHGVLLHDIVSTHAVSTRQAWLDYCDEIADYLALSDAAIITAPIPSEPT